MAFSQSSTSILATKLKSAPSWHASTCPTIPKQKETHHDRQQLHRKRRPQIAAQGGVRMGIQLRQRVLPEEGPCPGAHGRIMVGGRKTRLPGGESPGGIRRRW